MMTMTTTKDKRVNFERNDLIISYRYALREEMIKLGATDKELNLIKDATIRNAIRRNRKPEDVAWALLQ